MSSLLETTKTFDSLNLDNMDIENKFIYNLLKDFFYWDTTKALRYKKFFTLFKESLGDNFLSIADINDFNINVFIYQYNFFRDRFIKSDMPIFKSFYVFLFTRFNYTGITYIDGIDLVMISRNDFASLYDSGFRLVAYNPVEQFPSHDKWLIMPNGFEHNSTTIHSESYIKLDFSPLKYDVYKDYLKQWFWEEHVAINVKSREVKHIIVFLNFIYKLRKEHNAQAFTSSFNDLYISTEEVFTYMNYLLSTYSKATTRNHYIYPISKFLRFLNENKFAEIEPACFVHLVHKYKPNPKGGVDIPDNELIALEKHLRDKSNNSYANMLFYAIFHLALSTEFRISQITNLTVDCIHETMKEGQYIIKSNTKVSNGDVVEQHISAYTKRHLDSIINFTQSVRHSCPNEKIRNYIFLNNPRTGVYKVVNETGFNSYLSFSCTEIGLKKYYSGNLRDTYMTKAKEYALHNGLSIFELSSLTKHKNIETTNNHYVNEKIRDYLEATHSIVIGDVDIKGTILKDLEKTMPKENIVDDGCGYCNNESCNLFNNLDCPMCNGFIVTLDRIPYYEEKIDKINLKIENETIVHEKEHLRTLKRLYLAYLEKLYELKSQ